MLMNKAKYGETVMSWHFKDGLLASSKSLLPLPVEYKTIIVGITLKSLS